MRAPIKSLDQYQQAILRTTPRTFEGYPVALQQTIRMAEELAEARGITGFKTVTAEVLKIFDQLIWALGLAGEVGETLDMMKKHFGHGKPLDKNALKKEFGDVGWYKGALEDSFGFASSDVAEANVAKLEARYPNGFSVAAAAAKADEKGAVPEECSACQTSIDPFTANLETPLKGDGIMR